MRTCAKVNKFALLVEGDRLALAGVFLAKLNFIRLVHFLELCNSLLRRKLKLFEGKIFLDDLLHFSFDLFKLLGSKRLFKVKVIVKSVVDSRADSEFSLGIKSLYSLCKNV